MALEKLSRSLWEMPVGGQILRSSGLKKVELQTLMFIKAEKSEMFVHQICFL